MAALNLRAINLNQLPVLRALLREQSVLRAARALGLSPSATSEALGRLRELVGDPLLVQVGRTMRLTPHAQELVEPIERLCAELEEVLRPRAFDPATVRRSFTIATLDYVAFSAARALAPTLREAAPGIEMRFVDVPRDARDRIVSGEIDLAIVAPEFWTAAGAGEELHGAALPQDRFVAVFGRAHPLSDSEVLTAADQLRHPHIGFHLDWKHGDHPLYPEGLPTPIKVQHHMVMPMLAMETDYVAIVPESFASRMARVLPLEIRDLPGPPMTYRLFLNWGPVQHKDAAHRWFRRRLRRAMSAPPDQEAIGALSAGGDSR